MPTHSSLYSALAAAGLENASNPDGEPKQEPYVWLFPQRPNCAVLYCPDSAKYGDAPLHVNPSKKSWRPDLWERIRGVVSYDETAKDSNGFLRCTVRPGAWDVIARALGVEEAPRKGRS